MKFHRKDVSSLCTAKLAGRKRFMLNPPLVAEKNIYNYLTRLAKEIGVFYPI